MSSKICDTSAKIGVCRRIASIMVVFGLLVTAVTAPAQQGTGNIEGTVHDPSGAAIPGATVTIENIDRNTTVVLTTNDVGFYNSPPLTLGNYRVVFQRTGFATTTLSGITVTVGARVESDAELKVAATATTVEVQAAPPVLDTTSGTLGAVVSQRSIESLPLNGRNAVALTTLTPGVRLNTTVNQSGFANRGTNLSAISINGSTTGTNAFILDGQSNLATTTGEIAINPTVDAIQEFKVQSGVISAQYGYTLGGVINMVSRSGTDTLHGSVYEFLRNDALNARNYFARPPVSKPELRYNQFGGTLGGPIIRGRAFYFGNFEEYRFIQANPQFLSVPTQAERSGDFSLLADANGNKIQLYNPYSTTLVGSVATRTPYLNNQITNLDPVSVAYQKAFYPLPNVTPSNTYTNTNNFLFLNRGLSHMYNAMGRADLKITDKDNTFARFAYFSNYTNGGVGGGTYYPNPIVANRYDTYTVKELLLGETHTFSSTLLNDVRFSIERQDFPFQAASAGQGWPQKLGLPANVPAFAIPIVGNGLPAANQTIGFRAYTLPQFTDTVSKVIQRHTITLGTDLRYNIGANLQRNTPSGNFSFLSSLTSDPSGAAPPPGYTNAGNTYATFLTGAVSGASIGVYNGETDRAFSSAFFAQDDWQATPRLTLNLGVRYEYQQQPYEQNNGYSNFNPNLSSGGFLGIVQYANTDGIGRNFFPENYTNFAPRAGFAFKVTDDGKTVVRGGAGIYYALMFNSISVGLTNGFASTITSYTAAGGDSRFPSFQFQNGFPSTPLQPLGAALGPLGFLGQSVTYQDPTRWKTPQSQQYTLSIERQIPYQIVLQAAYVGNHGVHLPTGGYNFNVLNPSNFSLGTVALAKTKVSNPYAGQVPGALGAATITKQQSLLPFPYYGSATEYDPHEGNSIAHYLELSAQRESHSGVTVLFGYTFGKLLDSPVNAPLAYLNNIAGGDAYQNIFNKSADYALDDADVSQRATLSAVYNLPFGRGQRFDAHSGIMNRLIGGYQINLISVFQTGTPLQISGANSFTATRPNYVPGAKVGLAHPTTSEWFNIYAFQNPDDFTFGNVPRSLPHLRAPGIENSDLSIFKTTEITERLRLQIRAEAFNVLNHANFGIPGTGFSAASNPIVNGTGVDVAGCPAQGAAGCNTSGSFGVITNAADGRAIQLAAKLIF